MFEPFCASLPVCFLLPHADQPAAGDQCGDMLTQAQMGGMDEMGIFYETCLESLYPPGKCGAFCNEHTYECLLAEVQQSCCYEGGRNCPESSAVPLTCPVGCALVVSAPAALCPLKERWPRTLAENAG